MKPALELLGDDRMEHVTCGVGWAGEYITLTVFQLERFAQRAREEMREEAAAYLENLSRGASGKLSIAFASLAHGIRNLPVK